MQDIDTFLDEATHDAIFFSMGSILRSSDLPETKVNAFVEAFSKLKQRVLWKWETEDLPRLPENVRLGKWFPQSDILGKFQEALVFSINCNCHTDTILPRIVLY